MDLAQDKIDLIEKIIKGDKKFANNEDLFDDFFNETCKRSFLIVKTVSSDATLEAYLRKIATTSILNVLKNSGRLRRTRSGFMSTNEVPLDTLSSRNTDNLNDYSNVRITYDAVDIQDGPEDIVIKKEILQKVIDTVHVINSSAPEKKYLHLYNLRYEKGMTQQEIAQELDLSQSEVSKRLFKLMDKVKQAFN